MEPLWNGVTNCDGAYLLRSSIQNLREAIAAPSIHLLTCDLSGLGAARLGLLAPLFSIRRWRFG